MSARYDKSRNRVVVGSPVEVEVRDYLEETVKDSCQKLADKMCLDLYNIYGGIKEEGSQHTLSIKLPGANSEWTFGVFDLVKKLTADLRDVFGRTSVYPVHSKSVGTHAIGIMVHANRATTK